MAKRIRQDGTIVCAALHPARPGDTYIDDAVSYHLTVELGLMVTDPEPEHSRHGLWWWAGQRPDLTGPALAAYEQGRDAADDGPAPRSLSEWHEDHGPALWWCWRDGGWLGEAPYVGSPLDLGYTVECHTYAQSGDEPAARFDVGGWPGYHTHWTPIGPLPPAPKEPGR